jgi:hypothetical protein
MDLWYGLLVVSGGSLDFVKTIVGSHFFNISESKNHWFPQFFEGKFQNQRIVNSNSSYFINLKKK